MAQVDKCTIRGISVIVTYDILDKFKRTYKLRKVTTPGVIAYNAVEVLTDEMKESIYKQLRQK